ncbi:MAG: glycyl-tRNA synthetase beta chain [Acidobacteriaceae bacterium]|nr:glycyl-tRNA synthetase beta chain [Acidobacteriaceae bacterium]
MADFLLEIGVEEIPARMVDGAREELARRTQELLTRENLAASDAKMTSYSTPRRLAVFVEGINAAQADVQEQVTGPSLKVAYKDGVPTPAAEAFAKKVGVEVAKLGKISNPKGEYLAATIQKKGRSAAEVLTELLPKEMAGIYWAKNMYWRAGKPERFVRPVRWITALLDDKVVPLEFGGIKAAAKTRGHRILSEGEIPLSKPENYKDALEGAMVLVSPAEREHRTRKALDAATRTIPGLRWREDEDLLRTVVNLTEFPSVIIGSFEKEYLSLPEEVLVTVMRDHQKYFAVEDANGKLAPYFLAVLNTDSDPDGLIRHGNERVLRARFNDARFFWEADQKVSLRERVEMLKNVTFQKELGSYYEKAKRMAHLVTIGGADFDHPQHKIKRNALYEAAWLAKADLTTELVKEFTELQGIVGGLYARAQALDPAIADAIYDHYKPESMDDASPRTLESALLALADKADSIAGMFALGLQPTGSKDPFALRRQANGIVKIIVEHKLPLDLRVLFHVALVGYKGSEAEKKFTQLDKYSELVSAFFRERLEFYLRDVRKFAYDEVNAVLAAGHDRVTDVLDRVQAVSEVRKSADFEPISIAFKRIKNILRQANEAGKAPSGKFDRAALEDPAEKQLAEAIEKAAPIVAELRHKHKYADALAEIAKLRPTLDTFFEKVMVMVDDEKLRSNRLLLLQKMLSDFSTIADFSEIVTEKK